MSKMKYFLSACLFVLMHPAYCQSYLPPVKPWKGTSENLLRSTKDPLVTPFELSGGKNSATALELYDWFSVLMHTYPEVQRESIGTTAQNRDIWMYSIRRAGESKPVFLFQAGIHAGEIDGKDAGMLVIRELLEKQSSLLDQVNVLFIPILNVDGHERASRFNRINQRGPSVMGWRSNALNQNLNRDYTKLDTKEIQAVVQVINRVNPALYMDIHVTDGADYQYDITYGFQGEHAYSPSISNWMQTQFKPQADRALKTNGHIPGPLLFAVNDEDFKDGNNEFTFSPRFSHGYGDARHLPTILVENHSLKPFHQRVLGTCVLLMETLRILEKHGAPLLLAMEKDQNRLPSSLPLSWDVSSSAKDSMIFEGIASKKIQSKVTGQSFVEWLGEPEKQIIAVRKNNQVVQQMNRPKQYIIPVQYHEVIEGLKKHGIELKVLQSDSAITVSMYRLSNAQIQGKLPNQGRCRLKADVKEEQRSIVFPKGSVRIETNQPLGDLAILLLEPEFTDSYFQWGFFPECLERTEYFEEYVLEPYAAEQLQKDPDLTAAFESKKAHDEAFAKDQQAQLRWFYERSPYADETYLLYPVGRILN
jgi:hypothetical protein